MNLINKMKNKIRKFLEIEEISNVYNIENVYTNFDENTTIKKNKIWYRNNPYELQDFWHKVTCNSNWFWHKVPYNEDLIKNADDLKVNMVNIPSDILTKMLNEIKVNDELWETISKNINFKKLVNEGTKKSLITKKCAFKIIADSSFSNYPVIECIDNEFFDEVKKYGKTIEFIFYTKYEENEREYILEERYGYGYITYNLKDEDNREIPLDSCLQTKDLMDITFDNRLILATSYSSLGYDLYGNGISIFDGKDSSLMMLDEIVSMENQEVRNGRTTVYHPISEIEMNMNDGRKKRPSLFENHRISYMEDMSENASNKITMVQPQIRSNDIIVFKNDAINDVLQGRFSPATLGIDVKKMDNATAQREKEKTSQYTFNIMSDNLNDSLKDICLKLINCYYVLFLNEEYRDVDVSINISEYNSPSFSDKVDVIIPLYQNKVLSREDIINELFGDNKSEKEKEDILKRANEEFSDLNIVKQEYIEEGDI